MESDGVFDINGAVLYDSNGDEFHIKLLTKKGYSSKKSLMTYFPFKYEKGDAIISDKTAADIISKYTKIPKSFETPEQRYQREKAYGMIALAKRITDEIR